MNFESKDGVLYLNGQKVRIKGANWFGLENPEFALHGLWSVSMESVLDMVKANNINAIRLPFSAQFALGLDTLKCASINTSANPKLAGITAGQMLDAFCEECLKRNILIMPDMHRLNPNGGITTLWYSAEYPEEKVIEAWLKIVERCKRFPNVFAVDLKNEPHGEATWRGNAATDWASAAERIGNAILQSNPKLLIVVEGVERSTSGEGSWWGGHLGDARNSPIRLSNPSKLVYSPHVYGPDVFKQPYFSDPGFPKNLLAIWDKHFGFLKKERLGTLLIGEWGGHAVEGTQDFVWQNEIAQYFADNEIDTFYWCINPNSGDTGGLLKDDWTNVHKHKLDILQRSCPSPTLFNLSSQPVATPQPQPPPVPQPQPVPQPPPQPLPQPQPQPVPQPQPGTSQVTISLKEEGGWNDGRADFTKYSAELKNPGSPTKDVKVFIECDTMTQIWNMTDLGKKTYGLPSWILDNGGLQGSFQFGFIVSGKKASASVVGGASPQPQPQPPPQTQSQPQPQTQSQPQTQTQPQPQPQNNIGEARLKYLDNNADVKLAGVDPWFHYVNNGKSEGRQWPGTPADQVSFDQARDRYLSDYEDIKRAGVNPWEHYMQHIVRGNERRLWNGNSPNTPASTPQPQPQPQPASQPPPSPQPSSTYAAQMDAFLSKWPAHQFDGTRYGTNPYVNNLAQNKQRLARVFDKFNVPIEVRRVLIAMGMIESTELCVSHRDPLKDNMGDAANHSLFNLNTSMIRDILTPDEFSRLGLNVPSKSPINQDTESAIEMAVDIAVRGINMWGIDRYVSYVRGGTSGFDLNYNYNNDWLKMRSFKTGLSFIYQEIAKDASLLTDNRRVELQIPYV